MGKKVSPTQNCENNDKMWFMTYNIHKNVPNNLAGNTESYQTVRPWQLTEQRWTTEDLCYEVSKCLQEEVCNVNFLTHQLKIMHLKISRSFK